MAITLNQKTEGWRRARYYYLIAAGTDKDPIFGNCVAFLWDCHPSTASAGLKSYLLAAPSVALSSAGLPRRQSLAQIYYHLTSLYTPSCQLPHP